MDVRVFKELLARKGSESKAEIVYEERRGRHLVATCSLSEGDVVLECNSLQRDVLGTHKKRVCSTCFKDHRKRLSVCCNSCNMCWYCDETCMAKHKRGAHSDIICKVLSSFGSAKFNGDMESIIRLLLSILVRRDLEEEEERGTGSFEQFCSLQSHADDLLPKSKKDLTRACAFLHKQMQKHGKKNIKNQYSLDELLHHASRIESNCFGIFSNQQLLKQTKEGSAEEGGDKESIGQFNGGEEGEIERSSSDVAAQAAAEDPAFRPCSSKDVMIGREVYLEASMFNHSCSPTCEMSTESGNCTIRCIRNVSEGEELTISYIDESKPCSHRRNELKRNYHFDCMCDRCNAEKVGGRGKETKTEIETDKHSNKKKKKNKQKKNRKEVNQDQRDGGGAVKQDYDAQVQLAMQKLLQM